SQCFGTTTTGAAIPASDLQAVAQLLLALAPGLLIPASYQQALEQLLMAPAPGLPSLSPTPGAEQNTVEQLAYQSQDGQGPALTQRQSASQVNTTVQIVDASPTRTELQAELGLPRVATGEAVNQTAQGIWQLQIGCLIYWIDTEQDTQPDQSNTTIKIRLPPAGSSLTTSAAAVNLATQLAWQVQIGCLFWCWDATQVQTVSIQDAQVVTVSQGAPSQL